MDQEEQNYRTFPSPIEPPRGEVESSLADGHCAGNSQPRNPWHFPLTHNFARITRWHPLVSTSQSVWNWVLGSILIKWSPEVKTKCFIKMIESPVLPKPCFPWRMFEVIQNRCRWILERTCNRWSDPDLRAWILIPDFAFSHSSNLLPTFFW